MEKIELIIQCGLTYQPLTIAISLLGEKYDIQKLHIVTTHSAMKGAKEVMDAFFASLDCCIYGEFVEATGSQSDQAEYVLNLRHALGLLKHTPIAIIASGTNWMTYHFANELHNIPTFVVKTAKAFEEKSFFPQNEPIAIGGCGGVSINDGKTSIVYLQKLYRECNEERFFIRGRTLYFLGNKIELTLQEAAMFSFLASHGGVLDLENDYTAEFNAFCEKNEHYDSYRVFVDEFAGRFRQTVSKINSKIEGHPTIVQEHLKIVRQGSCYKINPLVLAPLS